MTITQDIASLAPGAMVEMFELDATSIGGAVARFHNGTNGLRANVVWQGNTYQPFPIQADGFEYSGRGQLPRPKLTVANVTGLLGVLVRDYGDLLGAKVTRKRTLAKYLDAANFPGQRNLFLNTGDFNAAGWTRTNASVVASSRLSQRGTATQALIEDSTAGVNHLLARSSTTVSGQTYTTSICAAERTGSAKRYLVVLLQAAQYGVNRTCVFDLAAGTITQVSASTSGTITKLPTGGYKCTVTSTATASATANVQIRLNALPASVVTYNGDGSSGLDMWDPQFELGSAATDYQPVGSAWSANPTADPTAQLPDEVYFVDRKATENKLVIEFELAASFDVAGVMLPRRAITQNSCPWAYRTMSESSACSYAGTLYFDINDNAVGSAGQDVCGKRLTSCKLRFGNNPLPFGGFPAAGLSR